MPSFFSGGSELADEPSTSFSNSWAEQGYDIKTKHGTLLGL